MTDTVWKPSVKEDKPAPSRRFRPTTPRKIVEALLTAVDENDWLQERLQELHDHPTVVLPPPTQNYENCPHCRDACNLREQAIEAHDDLMKQLSAERTRADELQRRLDDMHAKPSNFGTPIPIRGIRAKRRKARK